MQLQLIPQNWIQTTRGRLSFEPYHQDISYNDSGVNDMDINYQLHRVSVDVAKGFRELQKSIDEYASDNVTEGSSHWKEEKIAQKRPSAIYAVPHAKLTL